MKFSIISELESNGVEVSESGLRDVDTDRIDQTLQVTVFRNQNGRPIQVLFSGDKLLSPSLIRQKLGEDEIVIDIRFFPRTSYPYGSFVRQAPLSEQQGCLTIIDKDVLEKDRIHVISKPGETGYFIEPSSLLCVFPNARIESVTEQVITSTVVVSPKFLGHQNEEAATTRIEEVLGDAKSYLPVFLLPATKEEVVSLSTIKGVSSGELASIIESDPILFFYFIQKVFDVERQSDLEDLAKLDVSEMIQHVGTDRAITLAKEICEESFPIHLDVTGVEVIPQYYRFTHICAEVASSVIKQKNKEGENLSHSLMRNLIKSYRGIIGIMIGLASSEKMKEWIEVTNANPHRYSMDTQYNVLGFTSLDVAKYLTRNLRFPESYKVFFSNFGSPFYQGDFFEYVMINYVVSSFVSDMEGMDSALFKHLFKLHKHLAVRHHLMESIMSAIKQVPVISKQQEPLMWRFETVDENAAKQFLNVSKVDRNYFVYR